jgi:hypothetical protein
MKSFKIVLAALLVTASVITLSSFVSASFSKSAFAINECYYYGTTGQSLNKKVVSPSTNLSQTQVTTSSNWVNPSGGGTVPNPPTTAGGGDCNTGDYLCAVCFDNGTYTKQQAIDAIWTYFNTNGTLPHDGFIDAPTNKIKTYRQSTTANH